MWQKNVKDVIKYTTMKQKDFINLIKIQMVIQIYVKFA